MSNVIGGISNLAAIEIKKPFYYLTQLGVKNAKILVQPGAELIPDAHTPNAANLLVPIAPNDDSYTMEIASIDLLSSLMKADKVKSDEDKIYFGNGKMLTAGQLFDSPNTSLLVQIRQTAGNYSILGVLRNALTIESSTSATSTTSFDAPISYFPAMGDVQFAGETGTQMTVEQLKQFGDNLSAGLSFSVVDGKNSQQFWVTISGVAVTSIKLSRPGKLLELLNTQKYGIQTGGTEEVRYIVVKNKAEMDKIGAQLGVRQVPREGQTLNGVEAIRYYMSPATISAVGLPAHLLDVVFITQAYFDQDYNQGVMPDGSSTFDSRLSWFGISALRIRRILSKESTSGAGFVPMDQQVFEDYQRASGLTDFEFLKTTETLANGNKNK